MFLKQIGIELKRKKKKKNLTLEDAEQITGIHKNTLSTYENHPQQLKLGKLFHILKSYNVNEDIFFDNVCEYIRQIQIENK